MHAAAPTGDRPPALETDAMVKWIAAVLLLLPFLEIVTFIAAGASLGFLRAFGVLVLTTLLGFLVLRQAGESARNRLREAMARRDGTSFASAEVDVLKVLAGLLLVIPGFLTDVAGLVLLVPPIRHALARRLSQGFSPQARGKPDVIDLEPDEWRPVADPTLPDPAKRPPKPRSPLDRPS